MITLGNAIASKKPSKQIPAVYSLKFRNFVEKLMSKNPFERPSATEAIENIVTGGNVTPTSNHKTSMLDKTYTSI